MIYKYYIEGKNRFLLLFLGWLSLLFICYFYKEVLLFIFVSVSSYKGYVSSGFYFIFTDVTELFNVYFKLIFFISNQFLVILVFYHLLMFFVLGLYEKEYKQLYFVFKVILLYWITAIIVAYKIIIPLSWFFFLSFQQKTSLTTVSFFFEARILEYINFFINLYFLCLIIFQFLVFTTIFLNSIYLTITQIKFVRKYFYFSFIAFSTVVTPPDIFSQIIVSSFLFFFFELVIFIKVTKSIE